VIEAAQDVIKSGAVRKLEFGVADADAWAVGLACGGQIEIFLEPLTDA
jgi:xanthine/CO dehydrogenase XdhC/CoxF family maturation factor